MGFGRCLRRIYNRFEESTNANKALAEPFVVSVCGRKTDRKNKMNTGLPRNHDDKTVNQEIKDIGYA